MRLTAVLLTVALAAGCSSTTTNSDASALTTCRQAVRKLLKNPSTAKFSDESFARSGSTTTVTGMVVAENSLGGKVTYAYSCDYSGTTARVRPLQERR